MQYFRADVRVGALIFVSLVLLLVAAFVVGGVGEWFATTQEYTVLLPNANLLRRRTKVSYAGSPVGEVTAVSVHTDDTWKRLHPGYPVAATIVLRTPLPLREDARVELKTDGFIGERYLDITPGQGAPLAPGGSIRGSLGGVEGVLSSFGGLGGGFGELGESLRTLLSGTSMEQSLPVTLGSLHRLLEELRPRLIEVTDTLNGTLRSVQRDVATVSSKASHTLERLDTVVAENGTALKRLMRELHAALDDAQKTTAAAQKTLTEAQKTLGVASTFVGATQKDTTKLLTSVQQLSMGLQRNTEETLRRLQQVLARVDDLVTRNDRNLYLSLEQLRDMADNLKAATRQVRTDPSVLVWGNKSQKEPDPGQTADPATRTLQDRGRVGRYDRLQ